MSHTYTSMHARGGWLIYEQMCNRTIQCRLYDISTIDVFVSYTCKCACVCAYKPAGLAVRASRIVVALLQECLNP